MTASNTARGEEERRIASGECSSLVHIEHTVENADLYTMDPPEYTQLATSGELSVDAEVKRNEKTRVDDRSPIYDARPNQQPQPRVSDRHSEEQSLCGENEYYTQKNVVDQGNPSEMLPTTAPVLTHYLTESVAAASLASVRACSILNDRPAVWIVNRKNMALSPLAAAVLTKGGLVQEKDLQLISRYPNMKRDPTDSLSAVFLTTYDVVSDTMLSLVAGPIELGKQTTPMLMHHETKQTAKRDGDAGHVARQVALGTAKGFGRIITTGLKSPAVIMHGITRGFHNLPKVYGEEVRQYENVTGLRSGLVVSMKSFGCGLGDGIRDLIAKPIDGAEKNGVLGFAAGCAIGIANAAFKPAAGACGLVGYSSIGVYKSIAILVQ